MEAVQPALAEVLRGLPCCALTRRGFDWARSGHPWVYRDDLERLEGEHGDLVRVESGGRTQGLAFLGTRSKIALRWVLRGEQPPLPDAAFWEGRLAAARARRAEIERRTNAWRWVHDAADGFPGLVVDRYGPVAVVQSTIAGMDRLLPLIVELLLRDRGLESVLARNDAAVREKEGLPREVRVLAGAPPERVLVFENGPGGRIEFPVAPREGQKTGAFLDQRQNRWAAAALARGRVLDAFAYNGLFALHALRAATAPGARAVCVDSSARALELCQEAAALNRLEGIETVEANVFDYLKDAQRRGERFGAVILDPPAFAKSRAELPAAQRAYREINRRAMAILEPGGLLVTCSCSYNLSEPDFLELLRQAAADSHCDFRLIERRGQSPDHPVLLCHPESAYLKCILLEKVD